jgi:Fic family protein
LRFWHYYSLKISKGLSKMAYQRIQPFPDPVGFQFPELRALSSVWSEKKSALEDNGAFKEFSKKLQREWAIETGIIERLYSWDRGVTEILIEQGIDSSIIAHKGGVGRDEAENIKDVINDHLDIVEGLFSYVKGEEPLTENFIRNLQAQFTAHQDFTEAVTSTGAIIKVQLKKGEYKSLPNNPRRHDGVVHEYCPPEFTKEEMETLVTLYRAAEKIYSPEIKAAWLHHRFTQIHPFQDGNGRVARALASLVFLKDGLFPLVIRESDRQEYIGALETADEGNLLPLVTLFARRQREAILKAIGLEQQVQQSQYADQIISSALQILRGKYTREKAKIGRVYEYAEKLFSIADTRLHEVAKSLDPELRKVTPPGKEMYHAWANSADNKSDKRNYFQKQIVSIAKMFDYYANFDNQRTWARLTISTEEIFDYVLSFHGYGSGDTGLLAISAFTYIKVPKEEGGTESVNLHPACTDLFQFNYIESQESTEKRFSEWLDGSLAIALAEWKKSLQS